MDIDNGGPAFPITLPHGEQYKVHLEFDGMTLRDYFAAKAMAALMLVYWEAQDEYADATSLLRCQATSAYEYADAMIAERNKTK